MRKLIALAALAIVALAASCDTENVGGLPIFFGISGISPLGTLRVGDTVTITATVVGAAGPYNVEWNFGAGATPSTVNVNGENGGTTSVTVTLAQEGTFTGSVKATDAANNALVAGPFSFTYTVLPALNFTPTIVSATYNAAARTIAVVVADQDVADNNLTVTVATTPAGLSVTPASQGTTNGGTATFNVSATDVLAGGTGNVGFTVTDSATPAATSAETTVAVTIAPVVPPADTLLATPLSGSVASGDPVTVLVLTGVPANPFQYMVGAGLTVQSDAAYVANSFNVGAVGGAQGDPDGIWGSMNGGAGPTGGFLLPPDNFIQATDIAATDPGKERWDFNITPLGGSNLTTASGPLFNAQFTFTAAGVKTFGFQEVQGVKRTYYADDATEYFWGNITNDGSVVPNSVTIT